MGEVVTHAAWAERIEWYESQLIGEWGWKMKSDVTAVVFDQDEHVRAAAQPDIAPGLAAALNTVEGRAAYNRARLDGEGSDHAEH